MPSRLSGMKQIAPAIMSQQSFIVPPVLRACQMTAVPMLLDQFDARQILHVTFGSVLMAQDPGGRRRFYDRMMEVLNTHPEAYAANLESHFLRHLRPFVAYSNKAKGER